MIEICREDLNQKKMEEMTVKYPIAVVIANQGFGICRIIEASEKELMLEDLSGQVHLIEFKDTISVRFLEFEDLFRMMKEDRKSVLRINGFFESVEKRLENISI